MITVSKDFVRHALEARFRQVKDAWGSEASIALWEQVLDKLMLRTDFSYPPSYYVDNYLVNGDFLTRTEEQTDTAWQDFCSNHAIIYNDKYACFRFSLP